MKKSPPNLKNKDLIEVSGRHEAFFEPIQAAENSPMFRQKTLVEKPSATKMSIDSGSKIIKHLNMIDKEMIIQNVMKKSDILSHKSNDQRSRDSITM